MHRYLVKAAAFLALSGCLGHGSILSGQQSQAPAFATCPISRESRKSGGARALRRKHLGLKHAMATTVPAEVRKQAGVLGVRCSLAMDDRDSTNEFVRLLTRQFPKDPDVLFVIVHAYSELSTRTAQDLGRYASQSIAAHKLNAEALEMQGKWQQAQLEYEGIIQKDPNAPRHPLLVRQAASRARMQGRTPEQSERRVPQGNQDRYWQCGSALHPRGTCASR